MHASALGYQWAVGCSEARTSETCQTGRNASPTSLENATSRQLVSTALAASRAWSMLVCRGVAAASNDARRGAGTGWRLLRCGAACSMPLQLISDSSGSSKATSRTITMVYLWSISRRCDALNSYSLSTEVRCLDTTVLQFIFIARQMTDTCVTCSYTCTILV